MSRHGRVIRLRAEFLTIHWSAGLVNQAVALDDAVGLLGLSPGHVDRSGGQLAEVDEAGSARRCRKEVMTVGSLYSTETKHYCTYTLSSAVQLQCSLDCIFMKTCVKSQGNC